jgi:glycosyltransferase involved in cell wall biosynthesis
MISFVIPCFNEEKNLENMLLSFLWQKENIEHYEILLIDNNSTTPGIDNLYKEFFNKLNIYLIKQPKLSSTFSLCRARNIGTRIATNDWIYCLDSDLILPEDFFAACINAINNKNSTNYVYAGERKFIDSSQLADNTLKTEMIDKLPMVKSASNYFLDVDRRMLFIDNNKKPQHPWAYCHGGNVLFYKNHAISINGFNEAFDGCWGYEDVEFFYRLMQYNQHVTLKFSRELYVFHQEKIEENSADSLRLDKQNNVNWGRICKIIPGFKEFKENEYKKIIELSGCKSLNL